MTATPAAAYRGGDVQLLDNVSASVNAWAPDAPGESWSMQMSFYAGGLSNMLSGIAPAALLALRAEIDRALTAAGGVVA